jgi:trehalose-phosphatase
MKVLDAGVNLNQFFGELRKLGTGTLLLDYDGTLAPFRERRDEAEPYPGVRTLLESILKQGQTHLAIISGRTIADVSDLLGPSTGVEIWGSHGREHRTSAGTYYVEPVSMKAAAGLAEAWSWIQQQELSVHCEQKPGCIAFHTRSIEDSSSAQAALRYTREAWLPLSDGDTLSLHDFDGGIELRVPDRTKGDAVASILACLTHPAPAAYLGDDLTDEAAFQAMKGQGLAILVRTEFRPTKADLWIKPPEELLDFLSRWAAEVSGEEWIAR